MFLVIAGFENLSFFEMAIFFFFFIHSNENQSKFRLILDTQLALTDFHGDQAKKNEKKNPKWPTQKN